MTSTNITMSPTPIIAGIDEAGRGPLAGPVVAAACILPCEVFKRRPFGWSPFPKKKINDCLIGDSKMLSPEQREETFAWITTNCAFGVGMSSAEIVDRDGILMATEQAMHQALAQLKETLEPTYLLVDGCDHFWFDYPHSSVIRGDSLEPAIAAASIIAKVTRDRWMCEQAKQFSQYGFEHHKGYGSETHMEAIRQHGPCELHRKTFLRKFFEREAHLPPPIAKGGG